MDTILLSITIFGLAIVISFVVAALIKGIVMVLPMLQAREAPAKAPQAPSPQEGIPAEHVAAITAAVAAMMGHRHIIHIEDPNRAAVWTAEGRMIHQTSHAVPHGPKR